MTRTNIAYQNPALEDAHFVVLEGVLKKTNARGELRVQDLSVTFWCWRDGVTVEKLKKRFCYDARERNFNINPSKFFIVKVDGTGIYHWESIMKCTRCGEQLVVKWCEERIRRVETSPVTPIVLPDKECDVSSWDVI